MGNSQECSTELYFYCLDVKIKMENLTVEVTENSIIVSRKKCE
jgi:hypothetical protein